MARWQKYIFIINKNTKDFGPMENNTEKVDIYFLMGKVN